MGSFFERLTARDWAALGELLASGVLRIGPFGDRVAGRERYLSFLAGTVPPAPSRYENDVHGVVTSPDGMKACARVSEHFEYPGREPLHLEEAHWFHLDEQGLVARVEIFWQTPEADPGGFGSARSAESYADVGTAPPGRAS